MKTGFTRAVTWMCKHCYWEKFIHKRAYTSSCICVSKSGLVCLCKDCFSCVSETQVISYFKIEVIFNCTVLFNTAFVTCMLIAKAM